VRAVTALPQMPKETIVLSETTELIFSIRPASGRRPRVQIRVKQLIETDLKSKNFACRPNARGVELSTVIRIGSGKSSGDFLSRPWIRTGNGRMLPASSFHLSTFRQKTGVSCRRYSKNPPPPAHRAVTQHHDVSVCRLPRPSRKPRRKPK